MDDLMTVMVIQPLLWDVGFCLVCAQHGYELIEHESPVHECCHGSIPSVKRLVWIDLDAVVTSGFRVHNAK